MAFFFSNTFRNYSYAPAFQSLLSYYQADIRVPETTQPLVTWNLATSFSNGLILSTVYTGRFLYVSAARAPRAKAVDTAEHIANAVKAVRDGVEGGRSRRRQETFVLPKATLQH